LSAGRTDMNEQMQALCFLAGANSIFYGDKLLTTDNPEADRDRALFVKLGIQPEAAREHSHAHGDVCADANEQGEHCCADACGSSAH